MSETTNYKKAKFGAFIGIAGNTLLGVIKLVAGYIGRSSALIADSLHSFSDMVSSVVVLLGIDIASKPKDIDHPYGHDKAESLAGWVVSVMLICLGVVISFNSIKETFVNHSYASPKPFALWVAVLSIAAKEIMFQYKFRLGRRINSTSVMADAWHHRSDAISSLVAFFGILISMRAKGVFRYADHASAAFIGVMILWIGIKIFRDASGELMDKVADDGVIDRIRSIASGVSGVKNIEKLLVRKSGMHFLADIHVEVDKDMSVESSHTIATEVKERVKDGFPEVIYVLVHIEPFYEKSY